MKKITKVTTALIMAVILCFTVLALPACVTTVAEETQNNVSENAEITSSGETGSVESEDPVSSEVPPVSSEAEASESSEEQTGGDADSEVQSNVSPEPVEPVKPVEPESAVRPVSPEIFDAPERPDQTAKLMPNIAFDGTPIVSSTEPHDEEWEMREYGENSPYNAFDASYDTLWESEYFGVGDKSEWIGMIWDDIKNIEVVIVRWDSTNCYTAIDGFTFEILDENGDWISVPYKSQRSYSYVDIITFNGSIKTDGIRIVYENFVDNQSKQFSLMMSEMEIYEETEYFVEDSFYIVDGILERCIVMPKAVVLPEGIKEISENAFEKMYDIEYVTLPESLERISANVFEDTDISEIYIPENVSYIDPCAFTGVSLKSITVDPANENYTSNGTDLLSKDGTKLFMHKSKGYMLPLYVVPSGITHIGERAFMDANDIICLTLPDGVTDIEKNAIPWSFISDVRLPASLVNVADDIFVNCKDLTIHYGGTEEEWNNIGFSYASRSALKNATVYFECDENSIGFSLEEDLAKYETYTENVKRDGFVGTVSAKKTDEMDYTDVFRRVQEEINKHFDIDKIYPDRETGALKVCILNNYGTEKTTVYLDYNGDFVLIVYGE